MVDLVPCTARCGAFLPFVALRGSAGTESCGREVAIGLPKSGAPICIFFDTSGDFCEEEIALQ